LHLKIIEGLPDQTLLALAGVLSTFRKLASLIYLQRLGIIVKGDHDTIYLHDRVPPSAVLLLSSVPLFHKVILLCDLFFLIQYEDALSTFCSNTLVVTDVTIIIPDSELNHLALPQVPGVLRRFLVALSYSRRCKAITMKVEYHSSIQPRIPTIQQNWIRTCFEDRQIVVLMKTVTQVMLSTALLERGELLKVAQMLLTGPSVSDFHLFFHSKANVSKILSMTSFPALQYLRVSSPFPISLSVPFLRRHAKLSCVALFGAETYDTYPSRHHLSKRVGKTSMSTVHLPRLSILQLSAYFCSWLSAFNTSSFLPRSVSLVPTRWCPKPGCSGFCDVLRGLSLCLRTLALLELSTEQLDITFPHGIGAHLRQCHQMATLCAIPDVCLPRVKDVTLDFFFSQESFTIVCCFPSLDVTC
jgi:hypothetical protein